MIVNMKNNAQMGKITWKGEGKRKRKKEAHRVGESTEGGSKKALRCVMHMDQPSGGM